MAGGFAERVPELAALSGLAFGSAGGAKCPFDANKSQNEYPKDSKKDSGWVE